MSSRISVAVIVLAWLALPAREAEGQQLRIAAASDLQFALPHLASRFLEQTGVRVDVVYGSSGNFFAQIRNGAPFDVFLSADVEYPRQLADARLGYADSVTPYASGRLAIWVRRDAAVDLSRGVRALLAPAIRRIAVANPAHAPYGRAAVAALQRGGIYDAVRERLVLGESVSQAAQFAQSGNADAGIIALSLAVSPALRPDGRFVEVPESLHPPITQAGIVVAATRQASAARQFLRFLLQAGTQEYLTTVGFVAQAP